jgi:uncharacterized protein YcfJ
MTTTDSSLSVQRAVPWRLILKLFERASVPGADRPCNRLKRRSTTAAEVLAPPSLTRRATTYQTRHAGRGSGDADHRCGLLWVTTEYREEGTGIGALAGAATGALIGAAVSAPGAGAAIGGGLGAGGGFLVGNDLQNQEFRTHHTEAQIRSQQRSSAVS